MFGKKRKKKEKLETWRFEPEEKNCQKKKKKTVIFLVLFERLSLLSIPNPFFFFL